MIDKTYAKQWQEKHRHPCIGCGKLIGKYSTWCVTCASFRHRELNPNWQGGRSYHGNYVLIKLQPNDFFYPMAQKNVGHKGYVYEHRLIVARALGRCLQPWEIVHHKEGYAKDDNRYPETLQLVSDDRHKQITILENRIRRLEQRIDEQAKQIRLLKWRLKQQENKYDKEPSIKI